MITEDECDLEEGETRSSREFYEGVPPENLSVPRKAGFDFEEYKDRFCNQIRNKDTHNQLTKDLVQRLWDIRGEE